ncbi:MAG: dihydrolipoamide acetyltransferase family protein [Pseudomonadota bacterium]
MRRELLMPKLGLTMTEGALAEWMLAPGAAFKAGDGIFVVETDKVASEVPADHDGVLLEVLVLVGDMVQVGAVIGYVDDGVAGSASGEPAAAAPPAAAASAAPVAPASAAPVPQSRESRRFSTPLARRLAAQLAVPLADVAGSGPRGRIKAADVRAAQAGQARTVAAPAPAAPVEAARAAVGITKTKPTPTQATMARRLTQAKQQIPHFYLAAEAEVTKLMALRTELNAMPGYPKLTLTHMLVAAVGRALRELPELNRVWSDDGIVSFASCDVGVAVNAERGLLVPVIPDVAGRSLEGIARATQELIGKARNGELEARQMSGGAISISNAGMFNVSWMTPIINPGQSMILGVGSVRELFRPDANGQPALRRELGLVLAADHRILDGVSGLKMLNAVIASLEKPLCLLT